MALSREAQQALRRLTQELVSRISELVSKETAAAIDDALRDRLAAMTADLPPPPAPPAGLKRRVGARRFGSRATVERLVDVIKIAGGTAAPAVVSKALGLSPERRRALVAKAVAAGLVRTEGERRGTVYVLV